MTSDKSRQLSLHGMKAFGLLPSKLEMLRIDALEERHQPKVPFPHKHSFFQIVIFQQGRGWHEIDFSRHEIVDGAIHILKPGQVHAWELSPDTDGFLVEFELSALRKLQVLHDPVARLHALPDVLRPDASATASIHQLCRQMLEEQSQRLADWESLLQLRFLTLIYLFFRHAPAQDIDTEPHAIVQNFVNLVDIHHGRQHGIDFYAEKLNLTPKALTMRITRAYGSPPKKIIQDRCLLEAKRLLAYSALSSNDIARRVGFADPNYFTRLFRSRTGMTPNEFRASQKGGS